MIGKTILHYKILSKLGEGGMGVVYKTEDIHLKHTVALKFLPPHLTKNTEARDRFIHEAQAAAVLNHFNICTVYDFDQVEEQFFISMEYLEGKSLKEKIQSGPLPVDEAVNIAMQVAEGLYKAHEKRISPLMISTYLSSRLLLYLYKFEKTMLSGDHAKIKQVRKDSFHYGSAALKNSKKFAAEKTKVFRLMGVYFLLSGKQKRACRWWTRSIQEGEKLKARPELSPDLPGDCQKNVRGKKQDSPARWP